MKYDYDESLYGAFNVEKRILSGQYVFLLSFTMKQMCGIPVLLSVSALPFPTTLGCE